MKKINKVCVIGGGLMGRQIALNAAIHGYDTWLTDSFPGVLDKVGGWAGSYLAGRVEKGKMDANRAEKTRACFHLAPTLEEAARDADLVIEAIIEKREEKEALFRRLDGLVGRDTLLTTNSSFMVSSLFADCVSHPGRLANLHYFNPALAMKLVEIVRGPHTSEDTVEALKSFVTGIGKVPAVILKEVEGFIVNSIVSTLSLAALSLVEQGVATPEDIDLALENGLNHPMGPFRLMDLTGIDLTYYVMSEREKNGVRQPGLALIKEKFDAGEFGKKTGKGWYDYSEK